MLHTTRRARRILVAAAIAGLSLVAGCFGPGGNDDLETMVVVD